MDNIIPVFEEVGCAVRLVGWAPRLLERDLVAANHLDMVELLLEHGVWLGMQLESMSL